MRININYFGSTFPTNPDNLPETKWMVGPGTPRPIGFLLSEINNLYWTVRSFNVNIFATVASDPLSAFLSGGGTSGGILGATIGLSSAINSLSAGVGNLVGKTKIVNTSTLKNRKSKTPKSGDAGKPTPALGRSNYQQVASRLQQFNSTIQLIDGTPKYVISQNDSVNEGTLCGAGPIHKLNKTNSQIQIDFSNIIFFNNLYWPTIVIQMPLITSTFFTTNALGQNTYIATNGAAIGGINFLEGVINLYSTNSSLLDVIFAFGNVAIGTGCCDRFYFDGMDSERAGSYCKEGCAENGVT
ncbi:MAG: hypothetical protein WC390_11590 [Sulfurimonas sp.]|jgi:hypothetical protein